MISSIIIPSFIIFNLHNSIEGTRTGRFEFWSTTFGAIRLVYKLETANLFGIDTSLHNDGGNAESDEEWPPFRKVRKIGNLPKISLPTR